MERCKYELFIEDYFGFGADEIITEKTKITTDFGQLVNLLAMFDNERGSEDSSNENSGLNIPDVNNRTFIVTIECGEDTTDWKIKAPNKLAAKLTASANYNGKRFNILRCIEYGC